MQHDQALQCGRPAAAQDRCLGQGHRGHALHRRPRPAPHGVRQTAAQSARACTHPRYRHHPRPGGAGRLRRHHRRGPAAREVRHPSRVAGRGGALHGEGADGRRRRRRGGGGGRGDGGPRVPPHRRRLRAAARADVHPGVARAPRGAHPRVRRRTQRAQERRAAVRRRGGGLRRRGSRARGRLLLRGQHAPADGAARRGGARHRRRQADAVVLDADAPLRAPPARQDPRHAGRAHPRHRGAGGWRLRRQTRPLRPRDRGVPPLAAHRPPGEDRVHAGGSVLHPSRPPPGADVDQDGLHEGGGHHRLPSEDVARRRRLRLLRRGLDVLHRRHQSGDLQDAGLQVRGRADLHQQAAVRTQARSRHTTAALRARGAAGQGGRAARPRSRRHAGPHTRRAVHEDGEPPHGDDHRARRVHRQGGRGLRLARQGVALSRRRGGGDAQATLAAAAPARRRHRVLVVHDRGRHGDLLEQHAALRRRAARRPQRRRHRALRRHRYRPGLRLDPRVSRGRGARARSERRARPSGRHEPHARGSRLLLLARDADVRAGGHPGRRAAARGDLQGRRRQARGGRRRASGARAQGRPAGRLGQGGGLRAGRRARRGDARRARLRRLLRAAQARGQVQGGRRRPLALLLVLGVRRRAVRRRGHGRGRAARRLDRP